jgi:hypothetical protein
VQIHTNEGALVVQSVAHDAHFHSALHPFSCGDGTGESGGALDAPEERLPVIALSEMAIAR